MVIIFSRFAFSCIFSPVKASLLQQMFTFLAHYAKKINFFLEEERI